MRDCSTFDTESVGSAGALNGPPTMDAGPDDDAGEYTLVAVAFATICSKTAVHD